MVLRHYAIGRIVVGNVRDRHRPLVTRGPRSRIARGSLLAVDEIGSLARLGRDDRSVDDHLFHVDHSRGVAVAPPARNSSVSRLGRSCDSILRDRMGTDVNAALVSASDNFTTTFIAKAIVIDARIFLRAWPLSRAADSGGANGARRDPVLRSRIGLGSVHLYDLLERRRVVSFQSPINDTIASFFIERIIVLEEISLPFPIEGNDQKT